MYHYDQSFFKRLIIFKKLIVTWVILPCAYLQHCIYKKKKKKRVITVLPIRDCIYRNEIQYIWILTVTPRNISNFFKYCLQWPIFYFCFYFYLYIYIDSTIVYDIYLPNSQKSDGGANTIVAPHIFFILFYL